MTEGVKLPQSFCFAKIQPPQNEGAKFCAYGAGSVEIPTVALFPRNDTDFESAKILRLAVCSAKTLPGAGGSFYAVAVCFSSRFAKA